MIHKQFRAWRKRLGLTQQAAAAAFGVHVDTVAFYEGTRPPTTDFKSYIPKIVRLAMAAIEADLADPDMLGRWTEKVSVVAISERQKDALDDYLRNADLMVRHLLRAVHVESGGSATFADLASWAAGRDPYHDNKDLNEQLKRWANKTLQIYGLKVVAFLDHQWLAVADQHHGLAAIFKDTQWTGRSGEGGVWTRACWWVTDARRSRWRIGGKVMQCSLLPLDYLLPPARETQAGEDA